MLAGRLLPAAEFGNEKTLLAGSPGSGMTPTNPAKA
jgi:hypothetical protein